MKWWSQFMKSSINVIFPVLLVLLSMIIGCIDDSDDDKDEDESGYEKGLEMAGWMGITFDEKPVNDIEPYRNKSFSGNDYERISTGDGNNTLSQNRGDEGGYTFVLCRFDFNHSFSSIRLTWTGHGSQPFMRDYESKITIYLFNRTDEEWDNITWEKWEDDSGEDRTIVEIVNGSQNYLDSNLSIHSLVIGPYGNGDSTGTLSTDYFAIEGTVK